jgi:hypothetical protein
VLVELELLPEPDRFGVAQHPPVEPLQRRVMALATRYYPGSLAVEAWGIHEGVHKAPAPVAAQAPASEALLVASAGRGNLVAPLLLSGWPVKLHAL